MKEERHKWLGLKDLMKKRYRINDMIILPSKIREKLH